MGKLIETAYTLVTEENGVIYVKAKTRPIMVIALFELILGSLAYFLSRLSDECCGGRSRTKFLCFICLDHKIKGGLARWTREVKMKRGFFWLFILALLLNLPVWAGEKHYVYRETTGKTTVESKWSIKPAPEGYAVEAANVNEYQSALCRADYATLRWELRNQGAGTDLAAVREGDLLVVKGRFKGKEVAKEFKIDPLPWYQLPEVALAGFVRSEAEKTEFWIIDPIYLKHYKMSAAKQKTEYLTVNNQEVEAVQVKVAVSIFWSAHYWYRKADGVYLRFEGVRGGPGTPKTVVEFLSGTNN